MNKGTIEQFLESRPAISKVAFCREVGVTPQYLNMILRGERPTTEEVSEKIIRVMKKYGWDKDNQ